MPRRHRGDLLRFLRRTLAAPDDVHVGTQQDKVVAVDVARPFVGNVEHMIWPYDDEGRLVGEDVWEIDESTRQILPIDPADVLTVEMSAKLLDPLIKPLPARPW